MEIHLDFTKPSISTNVGKFILDNLNSEKEKESMSTILRGKKLQYGDANVLLRRILTAMIISDGEEEQEIALEGSELIEEVEPLTPPIEITTPTHPSTPTPGFAETENNVKKNKPDKSENPNKPNKKRETCRYFARGHCTRAKECRFDHPKICNIFREHGSLSTDKKGCDGKCDAFHPNACRQSLKDKTCSFPECRFYHLKGTKHKGTPSSQNTNNSSNQNWRSNQSQSQKNKDQNNPRSKFESKNRFAGLNKKIKNQKSNAKVDKGTKQENAQLAQTLEAILKRLSVMETKQSSYPHLLPVQPVQPPLSPAIPPPGTQTQYQWASQPHWTQTQTQY